mmetsp:Transcript_9536/g.16717  ORF Transcript_9536/g.16717 Transcript_9536/m.16717 type:complete len:331 (+) Transcript_9536:53-1045(+)
MRGGARAWRVALAGLALARAAAGIDAAAAAAAEAAADNCPSDVVTPVCEPALAVTAGRVVVVADVHGDGEQLQRALQTAGLLGPEGKEWIGGTSVLVQTGDIMDRGPDTRDIFVLLHDLARQARESGGCVVQILGNHEVLNLAGDFTYAGMGESERFGGEPQRRQALAPGSWLGDHLRAMPIIAKVVQLVPGGSNSTTIFSHAGVPLWLAEKASMEEINAMLYGAFRGANERDVRQLSYNSKLLLGQGPLWTREFALPDERRVCPTLGSVLKELGGDRMIVGHTVQETGKPTVRCSGQLILADTGMSRAYGGGISLVQLDPETDAPIKLF